MRLLLLRHGIAEERSLDRPDEKRRLTREGIERMREEAKAFVRIGLKPDLVLTSPLRRCVETAEIVADTLGVADRLYEEARIAPGFRLGDLQKIVEQNPDAQQLMVVGHQPDLGIIAGQLIASPALDVKKGGLVRIDADRIEPGWGVLVWMLAPGLLVK
jgi:phosphohistidine phosphatase